MEQNDNKPYVIFDQQLAGLLMFMKHRLKKMRPDKEDITKNIFIFDVSDRFLKDLDYLRKVKNNIKV